MHTPGTPVNCPAASAINAAVPSRRARMNSRPSRLAASMNSMFCPPGRPKMWVMPAVRKYRAMTSAVVAVSDADLGTREVSFYLKV